MKVVKVMSFGEILGEAEKNYEENLKELKEGGGMCLKCKQNPADLSSKINPFHCAECNRETEKILNELKKDSGFVGLRFRR